MKTLIERSWVRVVGHKDVPGRPALYATTKQFLDYFNLQSLDQLPPLSEIRDLEAINLEIEKQIEPVNDSSENEENSEHEVSADQSELSDFNDDDDISVH